MSDSNANSFRELWVVALVSALALGFLGIRHVLHRRHVARANPHHWELVSAPSASVSANPSASASSNVASRTGVIAEIILQKPQLLADKISAQLFVIPKDIKPPSMDKYLVSLLAGRDKNGQPTPPTADDIKDFLAIDWDGPMGLVLLDQQRWVLAASSHDDAKTAVPHYAKAHGATTIASKPLGIDLFVGPNGHFLAWHNRFVLLGSDANALNFEADHLEDSLQHCADQGHWLKATIPQEFMAGSFKTMSHEWLQMFNQQMQPPDSQDTKTLHPILARVEKVLDGASNSEVDLDFSESDATIHASVHGIKGTPFAQFVESFPSTDSNTLLGVPQDSVFARLIMVPSDWFESMLDLQLQELSGRIPKEEYEKALEIRELYRKFLDAWDGQLLVADSMEKKQPFSIVRLRLKDESKAKALAHDAFLAMLGLPKDIKLAPVPIENGVGEGIEHIVENGGDVPQGAAYAIHGGYLYFGRGVLPLANLKSLVEHASTDRLASSPAAAKIPLPAVPVAIGGMLRPYFPNDAMSSWFVSALGSDVNFDAHIDMRLVVAELMQRGILPQVGGQRPPDGAMGLPQPARPLPQSNAPLPPVVVPSINLPLPEHHIEN